MSEIKVDKEKLEHWEKATSGIFNDLHDIENCLNIGGDLDADAFKNDTLCHLVSIMEIMRLVVEGCKDKLEEVDVEILDCILEAKKGEKNDSKT